MKEIENHIWYNNETIQGDGDVYVPGWYFVDEAEGFNGPFESLEAVHAALNDYVESLDAHLDMEDTHWDIPND